MILEIFLHFSPSLLRLTLTCWQSLGLGLLVWRDGRHELETIRLTPVVPSLVVDDDMEVGLEHDPLPVPGGRVEAVVVPPALAPHLGGPPSLPHQSPPSAEGESDSVSSGPVKYSTVQYSTVQYSTGPVPMVNIGRQLGLPPLLLDDEEGEEDNHWDHREAQEANG